MRLCEDDSTHSLEQDVKSSDFCLYVIELKKGRIYFVWKSFIHFKKDAIHEHTQRNDNKNKRTFITFLLS